MAYRSTQRWSWRSIGPSCRLTGVRHVEVPGTSLPLVITPTVAGAGEWITTSIYRLTPSSRLAASTDYTVTVRAGLEDTTGGVLAAPYTIHLPHRRPDRDPMAACQSHPPRGRG